MRHFEEDNRGDQSKLLTLSPGPRLFVQRWVELTDYGTRIPLRVRPFWRSKIERERSEHISEDQHDAGRNCFHCEYLQEELNNCEVASLPETGSVVTDLSTDPAAFAERIALGALACGYNVGFLYHAYKALLLPLGPTFEDRLQGLIEWWKNNSTPRQFQVTFRVVGGGRHPRNAFTDIHLESWNELSPGLQACGKRCSDWLKQVGPEVIQAARFLRFSTEAIDQVGALAAASRRYGEYATWAFGHGGGSRPVEFDTEWVLVDDPNQSPKGKNYCFAPRRTGLTVHRAVSEELFDNLAQATPNTLGVTDSYSKALAALREGMLNDALSHAASGMELAFHECVPPNHWKRPRLFVEWASILLAVDRLRVYFADFHEYCLGPSHGVGSSSPFSNRQPASLLETVLSQSQWRTVITHYPWDELLNRRRADLIAKLDLGTMLPRWRALYRWDLARAVRARNRLVHRRVTIQEEYVLGIVLMAFQIILGMRLAAAQQAVPFREAVNLALSDYEKICSGDRSLNGSDFALFGWRRWRDHSTTDIAQGYAARHN